MKCRVLGDSAVCVRADSLDAMEQIDALAAHNTPMRLIVDKPISLDVVHAVSYNAHNVVHIFAHATKEVWATPYLAAAFRCGLRSAVTLYPIIPGVVKCADMLERIASLTISCRSALLFNFPRIPVAVQVSTDGQKVEIAGHTVPAEFVTQTDRGHYPSKAYQRAFMEKVHKYLDSTQHTCGVCGKDCSACEALTQPRKRA